MPILKNIRLGLLHVAVAITFVLINGILNRVMIHDMQILASVVAVLVVLPYLLSPLQVWIGQYSDTHPIMGYRRTREQMPAHEAELEEALAQIQSQGAHLRGFGFLVLALGVLLDVSGVVLVFRAL